MNLDWTFNDAWLGSAIDQDLAWPADTSFGPIGAVECIHSVVELAALQAPRAVAVEHADESWTYDRLLRRADHLAGQLRRLGASRDELIGVCLQRSPALIWALLGVLKSGAAYLPLDPAYPRERLAHMLRDGGVRLLLTERALLPELPPHDAAIICVDAPDDSRHEFDSPQPEAATGRSLAYAIFTSGSTGLPKAARIEHAGLCQMVRAQRRAFQMTRRSRVLQFSSLSFDASVSEIFVTLASGATLVLADPRRLTPGPELVRSLRDLRISVVTLPPSVLALLGRVNLPDLRTLVVAGERCSAELATHWSMGRRLINAYGPTEATVCATMYLCPQGPQPAPPIGVPLPHCRVYVLNEAGQPVATGEPGELYIGGTSVARDYLNRPELTAAKFVPDPFLESADARMYRTGDRVRLRADGNLEFLGRMDQQVKVRGVRIELEEIVAALESHPSVSRAVALVETDDNGQTRLEAYAVGRPDQAPTARDLLAWLQTRLPAAMLPATIAVLDVLPLTPNGKLDRQAVRAAAAAQRAAEALSVVAPSDTVEQNLAEVWRELLGHSEVSVTDDFFDRGGDSLSAMEMLARIERRYGYDVPMHTLAHGPTIEKLAAVIRRQEVSESWSPLVPLALGGPGRAFFCIHPGGGNVLCYRALAAGLAPDRPVFGIQAPGVDGHRPPLASVTAMATEYVNAIRGIQPNGPYLLGGWSFGGVVAYEMACQMQAQGQEVALLAAIDAGIVYLFGVLAAVFPSQELGLFGLRGLPADEQLALFAERTSAAQLIPPGASPTQGRRIYDVFLANTRAMMDFHPRRFQGRLTLFRAEEKFVRARRGPADEWRELCDDVVELTIAGNHLTCIQPPHVAILTDKLRTALQQADRLQC